MTDTLETRDAATSRPIELREAATAPVTTGRRGTRLWSGVGLVLLIASLGALAWTPGPLVRPEGITLVTDFLGAALAPSADGAFLVVVGAAAVTTVAYAVLGTVVSVVLGFVGGILSSEVWWLEGRHDAGRRRATAAWLAVRGALVLPRAIHEVIWGLVFLSVLGLAPLVAVLAIGIPFGAVTAKVFSELLDESPRRPYRAALAAGTPRATALLHTLLPVAWSDLLSYGFYRFECAIRSAAILGLVGAGGLGFQLALSLQTLNYREVWTVLYALIALSAATDLWSSAVRRRRASGARPGDRVISGSLVAALALGLFSLWWVQLDLSVLIAADTWQLAGQIVTDAWPPTLDTTASELVVAALLTIAMSVLAIVLAVAGGAVLSFPAAATGAPTSARRVRVVVTRVVLIVLRALPPPVWALLFLFVMAPGLLPGAMALGVYTLGILGRLMADSVENLDRRPQRALETAGASGAAVFGYAVIPAVAPRFVAFGLYRWEVTIRETVVVGVVGAGGLGLLLNDQLTSFDYASSLTTLAAVVVLTALVDATSAGVRRSLR